MSSHDATVIEVAGHELRVSRPGKVFFPEAGITKLDLVEYYLSVSDGALRGVKRRPTVLKRYPDGIEGEMFFQKRVPEKRPDWLHTTVVSFPSGRSARELCPLDAAHLVWAVNLGCVDLNPWAVRDEDLDHPDELRVDLDPMPGVSFKAVVRVADCVRSILEEADLVGFPKTSGSRGIHINVPIEPRWDFSEVRRAALAVARESARRLPDDATAKWWKEERGERVLVDYNQNARDRTVASAYSVRAVPDARVSMPFDWEDLHDIDPRDFTLRTVPDIYASRGDRASGADDVAGSLQPLLDMAERDEQAGLKDAPWPPNFAKAPDEGPRVRPSAAKGS